MNEHGYAYAKVKYLEKGVPFDYKRIDKVREVSLFRIWFIGNLLYGYKDEFNIVAISIEDVISINGKEVTCDDRQ